MSDRRKGFPAFEELLEDDGDEKEFRLDGWALPARGRGWWPVQKGSMGSLFCLKCGGMEKIVHCICEECLEKIGDELLENEV